MHRVKRKSFIMFSCNLLLVKWLMLGMMLQIGGLASASVFEDPLDVAARKVTNLQGRPIQAITGTDKVLIAAGSRGLLIYSNDNGKSWIQSVSAVQSDLVATHFSSSSKGWAVGHDGVVLYTEDGGLNWKKQLDGRMAAEEFKKYYQNLNLKNKITEVDQYLNIIEINFSSGPTLPFLDVWFEDEHMGFIVGSFGLIASTEDGGQTWKPWFDRIDNEDQLHLNSINSINGEVYIAAERGTIFRLDREKMRFIAFETEYEGSFFGLTGNENGVIAFGLEGTVYKSSDKGFSWDKLSVESDAAITYGDMLDNKSDFYLAGANGDFLYGNIHEEKVRLLGNKDGMRITGFHIMDNAIAFSSLEGVSVLSREEIDKMVSKLTDKK